jgi:TolB-like protein/DNA-binding winged helix-turn-helix (wHTH) protein
MQEPTDGPNIVRFGVFEADLEARQLHKAGIRVKVQQQPFQILALLLRRPGTVVTREELRAKLWPADTFVDFEHSLNSAIKKLRDVLGDDANNPRFIETLPRLGYRFITPSLPVPADVESKSKSTSAETENQVDTESSAKHPSPLQPVPRVWSHRRFWIGAGLAIVLAIAALSWRMGRQSTTPSAARIESLAVLPLENISGDPAQDYLAAGVTDELITSLGRVESLRVISRTSVMQFKGVHKPVTEIARQLNVDAIVEGTVSRSGDQIRIAAQLIQPGLERHLWARSYQREARDVLGLQNEIAYSIAKQIQKTLRPDETKPIEMQREISLDAYEAYWQGEVLLDKLTPQSVQQAADYFEKAIDKSPEFVAAYDKLSGSYGILGNMGVLTKKEAQSRTRALIEKGLQIDPQCGSLHAQKGWDAMDNELDLVTAGEEFKKAVELGPNGVEGHEGLGEYYAAVGKFDESILEMRRAQELDPLAFILNEDVCRMLFLARRYEEALAQCNTNLDMDPSQRARWLIAAIYAAKGMDKEAVSTFLQAFEKAGVSSHRMAALRSGAAKGGLKGLWQEVLRTNNPEVDSEKHEYFDIATSYAYAGDRDKAITWLERAFEARSFGIAYVRSDPTFDAFRSDVRFQNLLERIPISR